jgi:carboxymethylenebutenolidase
MPTLRPPDHRTKLDLSSISAALGGSKPLHGYLVTPEGDGPWPGLVMIHEIFGLDEENLRHADRLARAGYLTVALDLFSAGGSALRCLLATMRTLLKGQGRAYADIEAARKWLKASPQCTGKVGVIGFCMGGGFALMTANRGFDAAAPNYGALPKDMDSAFDGACPIVASYGARDKTLKNAAPRLEKALAEHAVAHDVKEYPNAGHAFLNEVEVGPRPLRPLFRVAGIRPEPDSATDAWRRIEAFLAEHLQ